MSKITNLNIKKPYVQKNIVVDKGNIKQFKRPEWHREYREMHVNRIMSSMKRGEHPSENITLNSNLKKSSAKILNGNHRIEAVRRIIEENQKFNIELSFTVYYNLTRAEEIKIYELVNDTKKETGLDKLKAHLNGTEIYKLLEQRFPFKVVYRGLNSNERNVMKANEVLASYMMRNKPCISMGAMQLIKAAKKLDENDFDRMAAFATVFKDICGEPSRQNIYSSYNIYSVFGKLYYTLVGVDLDKATYKKKIMEIISRNTSTLMMYSKGVHFQKELFDFVFRRIKKGKKMYNVITGQKE